MSSYGMPLAHFLACMHILQYHAVHCSMGLHTAAEPLNGLLGGSIPTAPLS